MVGAGGGGRPAAHLGGRRRAGHPPRPVGRGVRAPLRLRPGQRAQEGLGPGLAIVAELAAAMGATVRGRVAGGRKRGEPAWWSGSGPRSAGTLGRPAGGRSPAVRRQRDLEREGPDMNDDRSTGGRWATVVLVTGASAGIGLACADRLHRRGWTVIGASRRGTSSGGWTPLVHGCRRRRLGGRRVRPALDSDGGRLDAVVACAGWGLAGAAEHDPDRPRPKNRWRPTSGGRCGWCTARCRSCARQGRGRVVLISSHRRDHRHPLPVLLQRQQVRHGGIRRGAGLRGGPLRHPGHPGRAGQRAAPTSPGTDGVTGSPATTTRTARRRPRRWTPWPRTRPTASPPTRWRSPSNGSSAPAARPDGSSVGPVRRADRHRRQTAAALPALREGRQR